MGFFGDGEGAVVDCGEVEVVEDLVYVLFFIKDFVGGGGGVVWYEGFILDLLAYLHFILADRVIQ